MTRCEKEVDTVGGRDPPGPERPLGPMKTEEKSDDLDDMVFTRSGERGSRFGTAR